jgi:hypothetical protein
MLPPAERFPGGLTQINTFGGRAPMLGSPHRVWSSCLSLYRSLKIPEFPMLDANPNADAWRHPAKGSMRACVCAGRPASFPEASASTRWNTESTLPTHRQVLALAAPAPGRIFLVTDDHAPPSARSCRALILNFPSRIRDGVHCELPPWVSRSMTRLSSPARIAKAPAWLKES